MKRTMRMGTLCLFLVMVFTAGTTNIATAAEIISFATKPMGGIVYSLTAGMASIFTKYAGVQVRVEPIQSIKQWGPLMQRGELDLAFDNAVDSGGAYRAEGF